MSCSSTGSRKARAWRATAFGNLFIAAMTDVTGSFDKAILESSRVLAVRGSVIPATMGNITLSARMVDGSYVSGESSIASNGAPIERVMIEPADAEAHQPALEAIADAQLVLIGPGSLYTSILPEPAGRRNLIRVARDGCREDVHRQRSQREG